MRIKRLLKTNMCRKKLKECEKQEKKERELRNLQKGELFSMNLEDNH